MMATRSIPSNAWSTHILLTGQPRMSPPKLERIPGLGQTGPMAQGYPVRTTHLGQSALSDHQKVSPRADVVLPSQLNIDIDPFSNKLADHDSNELASYDSKLGDQLSIVNRAVEFENEVIKDLKRRLAQFYLTNGDASKQFQGLSTQRTLDEQPLTALTDGYPDVATSPSKPTTPLKLSSETISPVVSSSAKFSSPAYTPPGINTPTRVSTSFHGLPHTPSQLYSPAPQGQSTSKSRGRHHRTATPEQLTLRDKMGGIPVFTVGMKEQDDRCLLFDFFEQIKKWAANYTVNPKSLDPKQMNSLVTHPALIATVGQSSKMFMLVNGKEALNAVVSSIICRDMCMHALDDHFLYASGHFQSNICEELICQWAFLDTNAHEAKHAHLKSQQQIYTAIKNAPDHRSWRAACASRLTTTLLLSLSGLLETNLSAVATNERNHMLSELYVKGYRIGFRLRMAASQWSFQWPARGMQFEPTAMVNENRLLYGNVLRTMTAITNQPSIHEIRFAVSPTVTRSDFESGIENKVVVHHAMVHLKRKDWA